MFFQQELTPSRSTNDKQLVNEQNDIGEWVEDIRRVFFNQFKYGLNRTHVQMIRLNRLENYQVCNLSYR